jgi:hypothetical protein
MFANYRREFFMWGRSGFDVGDEALGAFRGAWGPL